MEHHTQAKYSKSLDPDEIEEVLMNEESDEELGDGDEVVEPHVQSSSSSEDEDDAEKTEVAFRPARPGDSSNFFNFTGPPNGINQSAASDINAESSPFSIFILFFRQVFQIIRTETNRYFHQYMSSGTTGSNAAQPPNVTIKEVYTFFGLIIQMGLDQRHSLKDYWSREEQYCTQFYSNVMARDRFFHILRFLHFENNDHPPNHDDPDYDRLWKIRKIFDTLNSKFCELYNPTEHLAVDEVIVLYKGRVVFRQYVPKKHKQIGIKIYKICDSLGYTYDMSVCLGKQRQHATTQTHGTMLQVIQRVEGLGHKIFTDSYFTSPALFDDLFQRKINACGTVHHDRRGMPQDIGPKYLKMKRGDTVTRVRGTLRAVRWKDRQDMYILTNMHAPPVEGNFTDESGQAIKPRVVEDYSAYMGFVDKSDRMVNSYGIARRTWKWTKKLFFHLTDMTILNAFLIHKSCGGKMTHKNFREILVQELIIHSQEENVTASAISRGRPSPVASHLTRLEVQHSQHWPSKGKPRRCRVCSLHKRTRSTLYFCRKCDVGLCVVNCFEKWHTLVNLRQ